jgi:hypothetical protein
MKLNVNTNDLVLSNVSTTGEFKIRNSAKAFNILSSGLYSNKIKAIIRELSCNAVDSHVAAGKADIPFEVHLPSMLEPWFSVKDSGLGLDHEGVVNIYTTYFESTKTESNDFIGALGLGSKSPFSYTDNFSVTAVKNGKQRIYSAFINEEGIPSIALMEEHDTTEGNGVEVKLSVTNRNDYYSFRNEAMEVFRWFKLKPRVLGDYRPIVDTYREKDIIPGVHIRNNTGYHHGAIAIMGNIAYPLSNFPNAAQHLKGMEQLLANDLEFHFEIGELDFAASREELSYIPQTIQNIKKKLENLTAELEKHVIKKVDNITCKWKKAVELDKLKNEHIFYPAVLKYAKDTAFPLVDPNNRYNFLKRFTWEVQKLRTDKKVEVKAFTTSSRGNYALRYEREYDRATSRYIDMAFVGVANDAIFVLNDLKIGATTRARYHFSQPTNHTNGTVYVVDAIEEDVTKKQAIFDEFLKELHNPPTVIKASTLDKKVPAPRVNTGSAGIMVLYDNSKTSRYIETSWRPYTEPKLDPKQTYYYVTLSNYKTVRVNEKDKEVEVDINQIVVNLRKSGLANISDITIYGVRKNRIKDIKELKNWIPLDDYLKQQIAKVDDKEISSLVAAEAFDNNIISMYNSSTIVSQLDASSPLVKFSQKYTKKKAKASSHANESISAVVALCNSYGKVVEIDKFRNEFNQEMKVIEERYPMLRYLNRHEIGHNVVLGKEVAKYITLIDKTEKK